LLCKPNFLLFEWTSVECVAHSVVCYGYLPIITATALTLEKTTENKDKKCMVKLKNPPVQKDENMEEGISRYEISKSICLFQLIKCEKTVRMISLVFTESGCSFSS
jgi:hypothetical protein